MHGAPPTSYRSLAVCSATVAGAVALAACSFELADYDGPATEIQVLPAGEFLPVDGREMKVSAWRINAALAAGVIEKFRARRKPPVIDYEHQTLRKEQNGQPAPAAGWFRDFAWREGKGLYATVEFTQRARDHIRAREYLYFSPVFTYDEETGDVLDVLMGAVTNDPALDNLEPLAVLAAAHFGNHPTEKPMNKLLAALCAALGLAAVSTTEDQAVAACAAIKPQLDELGALRKALGIAAGASTGDAVAACTALKTRADESGALRRAIGVADNAASTDAIAACAAIKTKADTAGGVDPAKYAPISVVEEMRTQIAALSAKSRDGEVAALVDAGLADGRLLPAMKGWATDLGKSNLAALTQYLSAAPPIAALTSTQTGGAPPVTGADAHGLTLDQLAVCTACNIAPEAFAKSLKAISPPKTT
jgi:phage I-like protein